VDADDSNVKLEKYCQEYWEYSLEQDPTFATYIGDHRYDDRLQDISEEGLSKQRARYQNLLSKVEGIDDHSLSRKNRLNRAILKETLSNHIRLHDYKMHYLPIDHLEGPHIDFPQIIDYHPFKTDRDIENYLKRLRAFPSLIDQAIGNMERGIRSGMTAFQRSIDYVLDQVSVFVKFQTEENPLYSPVSDLGEEFSEAAKAEIKKAVAGAISSGVAPAYEKLFRYLRDEYRQRCRTEPGIWSLPGGDEMYGFFVRYRTTADLSPEEVHETGRKEVERIRSEIRKVMKKAGFDGEEKEFARALRDRRELYHSQGEEIIEGFREILSKMDERLPEFFGRLPRAEYVVKEIEQYRQEASPAAYYYPPPGNFSRPGYFYVNTYKPGERPRFTMEALAYHEAVPGHHLQVALMQELRGLPDFRRYQGSTALIEGWALYAEKLSKEMGFYRDVYSEYGRLTFEVWRAVRLVVDTGMHYYRWDRDKSIAYCRQQTGLEDHDTEVEVDRYAVIPGQALAYKIGELKILELRGKAQAALGDKFDIRDFHDRLLEHGALPISALETVMQDWMTETKAK